MTRFQPFFRYVRFLLVALAPILLLFCARIALGQEEEAEAEAPGWSLNYLLVVLGIALGLVVVCRPGGRHKEIRSTEE